MKDNEKKASVEIPDDPIHIMGGWIDGTSIFEDAKGFTSFTLHPKGGVSRRVVRLWEGTKTEMVVGGTVKAASGIGIGFVIGNFLFPGLGGLVGAVVVGAVTGTAVVAGVKPDGYYYEDDDEKPIHRELLRSDNKAHYQPPKEITALPAHVPDAEAKVILPKEGEALPVPPQPVSIPKAA